MRHFQNLHKRLARQFFVLSPESADRVVIRMGVRAEHAHRNTVIARLFNAPAAKHAGGLAVEQQAQQQSRWILLAARAPFLDFHLSQVQFLNRIDNEQAQVICGNPIPQVRG